MTHPESAYHTLILDEDIHLIPKNDRFSHYQSPFCMCNPQWDESNQKEVRLGYARKRVYVHRLISQFENLN